MGSDKVRSTCVIPYAEQTNLKSLFRGDVFSPPQLAPLTHIRMNRYYRWFLINVTRRIIFSENSLNYSPFY